MSFIFSLVLFLYFSKFDLLVFKLHVYDYEIPKVNMILLFLFLKNIFFNKASSDAARQTFQQLVSNKDHIFRISVEISRSSQSVPLVVQTN